MIKNRAAFFNDNPMDYNPNMFNQNMPMNEPYQMNQMGYQSYNQPEDVNARIAKLERQINRLEHRISVLEQNNTNYPGDDLDSNVNNMYMV